MKSLARPLLGVALALILPAAGLCANAPAANADSSATLGKIKAVNGRTIPGRYLVSVAGTPTAIGGSKSDNLAHQAVVRSAVRQAGGTVRSSYTSLWNGISVSASAEQIRQIAAEPGVTAVFPERLISMSDSVAPTAAVKQAITLRAGLSSSYTGTGIKVGIIDTGIDYNHPEFGGSGVSGNNADFKAPGDKVQYGYDFAGDVDEATFEDEAGSGTLAGDPYPDDCSGHGTHVAGIVASNDYGVAPGVTLGAYKVAPCGPDASSTDEVMLKAMTMAANDGMNVVNLSMGADFYSWPDDPATEAANNLVKKGVLLVTAAGNIGEYGLFGVGSPSSATTAVSVAASDHGTSIASFSSYGPTADLKLNPTIAAPGVAITSTLPLDLTADEAAVWTDYSGHTNSTGIADGTSMASPYVAGVAALVLQARPELVGNPATLEKVLYSSATQLNATAAGQTGHPDSVIRQGSGEVNLDQALKTTVVAGPATLSLGSGTTKTATITLTNLGGTAQTYTPGLVTAASVAANTGSKGTSKVDWAYADATAKYSAKSLIVPANGSRTVKVKLTAPTKALKGRNTLLWSGWLKFASSTGGNTVSVPFVGFRGNYQKVKALTSAGGSLPTLATVDNGTLVRAAAGASFTLDNLPYVVFHLDYPVSDLRLKVINTSTKKSYWTAFDLYGTTKVGTLGRDIWDPTNGYYGSELQFSGLVANGKKLGWLSNGSYKFQLTVLKPTAKASKKSNWETWTSPRFWMTSS